MADFSYTPPVEYATGLRDIVNMVGQSVDERARDAELSMVWSSDSTFVIPSGGTVSIVVSPSDPIVDAQTPMSPGDITSMGPGAVTASLNRTSGQSVTIVLMATGGEAVVSYLQLIARPISVVRTVGVAQSDPYSIGIYGTKAFQGSIPWATVEDANAVASVILSQYSERTPIVRMHVQAQDEPHLLQILTRAVSDRIRIVNGELGMDSEFFIEKISHVIHRTNPNKLPVHETVFGCDRIIISPITNPFTFDKVGAGFNDGQFGGLISDDPATIFIFDHAVQGKFDTGVFGT